VIQKLALIANQTAIASESFGAVDVGSCCSFWITKFLFYFFCNFYFFSKAKSPALPPPPNFLFVAQFLEVVVVVFQVMRIKKKIFQNLKPEPFPPPRPSPTHPSFLNFCDVAMNGQPWSTRGISQIWVHVEEEDPSFPP